MGVTAESEGGEGVGGVSLAVSVQVHPAAVTRRVRRQPATDLRVVVPERAQHQACLAVGVIACLPAEQERVVWRRGQA